jgi:triacylglycerol lipase
MGVPLPNIPTPGLPYLPPLWRESRLGFEAARLLRSPIWRGVGVPPGEGRPVLLIPGFMAGDGTLATMAKWLRANGYWTRRAGIRANIGCSQDACDRIEERLEALAARTGGKVAIVGQSRGGVLARVVATRRPDLVSGVVALGAPTVGMLRVHPLVLLQVGLVGALGTGRVPGLFRMSCLRGGCCEPFRTDLEQAFPPAVRYVSVYSRSDGIVDWRACLDGAADELVEIHASHCGMAVSVEAYEQVARALAAFAAGEPASLARAA